MNQAVSNQAVPNQVPDQALYILPYSYRFHLDYMQMVRMSRLRCYRQKSHCQLVYLVNQIDLLL